MWTWVAFVRKVAILALESPIQVCRSKMPVCTAGFQRVCLKWGERDTKQEF